MGYGLLLEVDIWLLTVWRVVSGQPASASVRIPCLWLWLRDYHYPLMCTVLNLPPTWITMYCNSTLVMLCCIYMCSITSILEERMPVTYHFMSNQVCAEIVYIQPTTLVMPAI